MKRSQLILVAAATVIVGTLLLKDSIAQPKAESATPAVTKVAACDLVRVFAEYQKARDMETKFANNREALKAEDQRRTKQIESLEGTLSGLLKGGPDYDAKLEEYTKATIDRDVWRKVQDAKEASERDRLSEEMYKEILAAIGQVAKAQGYQIVVNNDESAPEKKPDIIRVIERRKVLYNDPSVDITTAVIAQLNRKK